MVDGDNDIVGLGCCSAAPGYDTASGLGSIRFDQLAAVLEADATPSTTTSSTSSTAPAGPTTSRNVGSALPAVVTPRFTG